jgi:hypothetical protein
MTENLLVDRIWDITAECQNAINAAQIFPCQVAAFNPSIVYINTVRDDDVFVVCCRCAGRNQEEDQLNHNPIGTIQDPRHPLPNGFQFPKGGIDTCVMFLAKYNNANDSWSITHLQIKDTNKRMLNSIRLCDTRLMKHNNVIIATANALTSETQPLVKKDLRGANTPVEFEQYFNHNKTLELRDRVRIFPMVRATFDAIMAGDEIVGLRVLTNTVMCPDLSLKMERNWMPWIRPNGSEVISYHLRGRHEVLMTTSKKPFESCVANVVPNSISTYFRENENIISVNGRPVVLYSLSTPALPFGEDMLAVGHVKFRHDQLYLLPKTMDVQNLQYFHNLLNGDIRNKHMFYTYAMFFYTFNPNTLAINRMSNVFIPLYTGEQSMHNIYFATNLTKNGDMWWLSYGVGDLKCRVARFTTQDIENALNNAGRQHSFTIFYSPQQMAIEGGKRGRRVAK